MSTIENKKKALLMEAKIAFTKLNKAWQSLPTDEIYSLYTDYPFAKDLGSVTLDVDKWVNRYLPQEEQQQMLAAPDGIDLTEYTEEVIRYLISYIESGKPLSGVWEKYDREILRKACQMELTKRLLGL